MEYNNTYIEDGDIQQLDENQSSGSSISLQYDQADTGVDDLGTGSGPGPLHHPIVDEEELLAAQEAADAAVAEQQQNGTPGGVFNNVAQGLSGKNRDMMMQYWQETINAIENEEHDFKNHQLPLARIKKVMKTDEDVRMISAEAPILFAKGCDIFITELTMRAWIHAEENKRRTLQKSDIAAALTKSDMFDFLIDVVPREEEKPKKSYSSRPEAFASASRLLLLLQQTMVQGLLMHPPHMRGAYPPLGPLQGSSGISVSHIPPGASDRQHAPGLPQSTLSTGHPGRAMYSGALPGIPTNIAHEGNGNSIPHGVSPQIDLGTENQNFAIPNGKKASPGSGITHGANPDQNGSAESNQPPKTEPPYYESYSTYENNF